MKQTKEGTEINVKELIGELHDGVCWFEVLMKCDCLPVSFTFRPGYIKQASEANALVFASDVGTIRVGRIRKVLRCKTVQDSNQLIYKVEAQGVGNLDMAITIIRHFGFPS